MADYPSPTTPFRTIGLREVREVNGQTFTRKKGTTEWTPRDPAATGSTLPPPPPPSTLYLSLVLEEQGLGEPRHWSLFAARENEPGYVYQVTGDDEHMTYAPSDGVVDIFSSDTSFNIYQLAAVTEEQDSLIRQVAEREPPPRAPDRQSVKENCQGWAVRVIGKLVEMGIVPEGKVGMARSMMESV